MLQITGSKGIWHALVTSDDLGKPANINNATNSIALLALGASSGVTLQAAFAAGSFGTVSGAAVQEADRKLLDALEAELGKRPESLRTARFTPGTPEADGDETDRLLTLVTTRPTSGGGFGTYNVMPEHVWPDSYTTQTYDGTNDDLLTAGYGTSGLAGATTALVGNAANLRRYAIHTNYRALIDANKASGGFGTLYGPNIAIDGSPTLGEGKIPGLEAIAYSGDASGKRKVTLMVQVPDSFSTAAPCIVTATSSGSRGIYGAIGTAGEWGLKHGCAVAYTDKGSGNGMHDLARDTVNLIDGTVSPASTAGKHAHFAADISKTQRDAFNLELPQPHRLQTRPLPQEPREGLGPQHAGRRRLRLLRAQRKYATADATGKSPA
jgi:hydroxybutyrate-dimer hydrolase